MQIMNPKEIETREAFSRLFPIKDDVFGRIQADMKKNGYDESQAISLATWDGQDKPVCMDGHTRLKVAQDTGIESVPVFIHRFSDENEALTKAIQFQVNRRNLSDGELFKLVRVLDARKPRGGDRRSKKAKSAPSTEGTE